MNNYCRAQRVTDEILSSGRVGQIGAGCVSGHRERGGLLAVQKSERTIAEMSIESRVWSTNPSK